ncbi:iron-containing redox enzyme family protein [Aquihabitans daechungensis]|uniref:iron-containing redox enzyme family protein n=1 Tax=Aquihabitans daechungensis TaxID=1052257 RepID=UPI003BA23519
MSPMLPTPRGPLSSALLARLADGDHLGDPSLRGVDPLTDDDFHLALWCCYELYHHGFEGVDDDQEWDPEIVRYRRVLESVFEAALRCEHQPGAVPSDPQVALRVIGTWAGPPLASTVAAHGELHHLQELAVHRSAYQLKEADPHTWAIPRLSGRGRSAMIEIQADEYGSGVPGEAHAELFADAMDQLGLCSEFGHYIDRLPGTTLATDNLVTMFGLNRRLRGALVGHLALFEMCSVTPMAKYLAAARRVGGLSALERFYEVHVDVDAHHADLALNQMVAGFVADEPQLAEDVIFGAAALAKVEGRFAHQILRAWEDGGSSLRPTLEAGLGVSSGDRLVEASSFVDLRLESPRRAVRRALQPSSDATDGLSSAS